MKGNRNAYEAARIKGWLDDYDWLNYKGKEKTILKTMCTKVETAKKDLLAAYEELKLVKDIEPQNSTLINDIKADIEHKKIIYDYWKDIQKKNDDRVA